MGCKGRQGVSDCVVCILKLRVWRCCVVVVCTVWSCKHCVKAVKPFRKRSGIVRSAETVALAATAVALSRIKNA